MIYIGLDVHKRFSRMGCFDPATEEAPDVVQQGREVAHAPQDISSLAPKQSPSEAPDGVFRGYSP